MNKNELVEKIITKSEAQSRLAELEDKFGRLYDALEVWRQCGIPRKTLVILLAHSTKVSQRDIKAVLEGMDDLFEDYFAEED